MHPMCPCLPWRAKIDDMKVLNLQCVHQHDFEGWFASEDDYTSQLVRGLVSCPLCGDARIQKMLTAPRLNLRRSREREPTSLVDNPGKVSSAEMGPTAPGSLMQAQLLSAMRLLLAKTEDVGERFADEARAMHQGEMDPRSIRGRATPEVAMALLEEGIEVMPLLIPPALKETLQ